MNSSRRYRSSRSSNSTTNNNMTSHNSSVMQISYKFNCNNGATSSFSTLSSSSFTRPTRLLHLLTLWIGLFSINALLGKFKI